ncbi:MAG: putative endonuclease [Marivirga sp.]|jgi:putative endonuclease
MNTKQIGDKGERMAESILLQKGYEVLEKNFRHKRSEIDLICLQNDLLVFIEVKTLQNEEFHHPEDKVDQGKINKIIEGADAYIHAINWEKDIRFDIISINLSNPEKHLHIEDAFY